MSQKRKNQRAKHAKEQEEQGKKVVMYVFGGLIALAVIFAIYTMLVVG